MRLALAFLAGFLAAMSLAAGQPIRRSDYTRPSLYGGYDTLRYWTREEGWRADSVRSTAVMVQLAGGWDYRGVVRAIKVTPDGYVMAKCGDR